MMSVRKMAMIVSLSISAFGTSGCGMGSKLVKSLNFSAGDESGHFIAGFDAKVNTGLGSLPEAKLPIYDPQAPARFLGYLETHPDGTITVRVDVTEASHVQTMDGSLLPNGRQIPVVLPTGVTPIAIPVINSNSKVYIAVGQQNIMAGVAVTILANTSAGTTDWLRILQSLQTNIFYPFQITGELKGTAGFFSGNKVGVGVFAVQTIGGGTTPSATSSEAFGVKTQYPVGNRLVRVLGALGKVRDTKVD